MYTDFQFYSEVYKGKVSAEDFVQLEIRAASLINQYTFGRIEIATESVKYAVCELIDNLNNYNIQNETRLIKSEKVGDHSVTFADSSFVLNERTNATLQKQILFRWLPSYLLFRGV